MAGRRINTIGLLFAGLAGAGAAVVACESPEAFERSDPGTFFGGDAGVGEGGGGGAGSGALGGDSGLLGAGGRLLAGAGGDPLGGGAGALGSTGGMLFGAGGDGAAGGEAEGGSSGGDTSPYGGASGAGAGGIKGGGAVAGTGQGGASSNLGAPGGAGGGGGGGPACPTCTLSIECRNNAPTDTTAMNAELWISNTGTEAVPLRQIKVRYYYTNEGGPMVLEIFYKSFRRPNEPDVRGVQASFVMTTGKLMAPAMDFSDVAISSSDMLDATVPFYFKMSIHDQAHSRLILTNDYSNGPPAIGPCPHIVAFVTPPMAPMAIAAGIPPR